MPRADLVLEGGGVKGLGLVGTVTRLMEEGFTFERVLGTSAGAIVAALVAAGADRRELEAAMNRLEYDRVPDRGMLGVPVLSEGIGLLADRGVFRGDYIHDFVNDELARLGKHTFGDFRRTDPGADGEPRRSSNLVVTATDVTNGRLLRLPWDYELLGLEPDAQPVADAVRASIAIPLFFAPVVMRDRRRGADITLVDGGVLSNFPIAVFDRTDGATPRWPTLGVKIMPALPETSSQLLGPLDALPRLPVVRLLEQVLITAVVGHDQTYLEQPCVARRTITVDTAEVGIVDFWASEARRVATVTNGRVAAEAFLSEWDWDEYLRNCR